MLELCHSWLCKAFLRLARSLTRVVVPAEKSCHALTVSIVHLLGILQHPVSVLSCGRQHLAWCQGFVPVTAIWKPLHDPNEVGGSAVHVRKEDARRLDRELARQHVVEHGLCPVAAHCDGKLVPLIFARKLVRHLDKKILSGLITHGIPPVVNGQQDLDPSSAPAGFRGLGCPSCICRFDLEARKFHNLVVSWESAGLVHSLRQPFGAHFLELRRRQWELQPVKFSRCSFANDLLES
mmetsp:Transcript_3130/g.7287  ORF Transcript_3130/g.7287 Transcript_3130/m.7287 type:complete len:237 (-) Transcript_3130:440-1150(-)